MSVEYAVRFSVPQLIRLHGMATVESIKQARNYLMLRDSGADDETVQLARIASDECAAIVRTLAETLGYYRDAPEAELVVQGAWSEPPR